jgi:hypothetical protein
LGAHSHETTTLLVVSCELPVVFTLLQPERFYTAAMSGSAGSSDRDDKLPRILIGIVIVEFVTILALYFFGVYFA